MSALLHALVAMGPPITPFVSPGMVGASDEDDRLPITSYACQWKTPRKRKENTMKVSECKFEKYVYGHTKKRKLDSMEDFDPRPSQYRGTAPSQLSSLLDKVRGKGLCVSLLLDPSTCHWSDSQMKETSVSMPGTAELQQSVEEFKKSLLLPAERRREIERQTRDQQNSSLWFEVRQYQLTASMLGEVLRRSSKTPPDSLVVRIIDGKRFTGAAVEWGVQQESVAIKKYVETQLSLGHSGLAVVGSGFLICESHPFLGATPDGSVYDPSSEQPYGFVEVKCPYSHRSVTPEEACSSQGFCCTLVTNPNGEKKVCLHKNHIYYAQVQGQMAIGERSWCDFVVFTTKGISIERIDFDQLFWENELLPKLVSFYNNCIAPEIVSPVRVLGLPIRNLMNISS